MPAIYLGSIAPFKVSVFKVSATSGTGRSMIYSYKKGRLPQGLEIQPDGEIQPGPKINLETQFEITISNLCPKLFFQILPPGARSLRGVLAACWL